MVTVMSLRSLLAAASAQVLFGALHLSCSRPAPSDSAESAGAAAGAKADPAPAAPAPQTRTRVIVFAASSLTDAFNVLEQGFEAAHPEADIALSYGGSQVLKLQISEGAPCDVFASADEAHMAELVQAGRAEPGQVFAENELTIIVPPDNPAKVETLKDLTRAERFVIGAQNVPVGAYTRQLLARTHESYGAAFEKDVLSHVVSEEPNVRLVRAKVELGEADAAIVYGTDASNKVKRVSIPPELNVRARYPIARITRAPQPELARAWVDYVLSPVGKAQLGTFGFLVTP
jgi:molybdate transport system substrate-binding protein